MTVHKSNTSSTQVCVCVIGDVEIGLMERNGQLEIEIMQARRLTIKPGSKEPPGDFHLHNNLFLKY